MALLLGKEPERSSAFTFSSLVEASLRVDINNPQRLLSQTYFNMPLDKKKTMISVCFNDNANQVIVLDLSTLNADDLWYADSDLRYFRQLQKEAFTTVVPSTSERMFCSRNHVKNVLLQQSEHEKMGISDPRGLATLSKVCSKAKRQRAYQAAIENTQEVYDVDRLLVRQEHCPPKASDGKRVGRRKNRLISTLIPPLFG
jgi:hypothetical protein